MMFSVCIPIYNHKTKLLVEEIKKQITSNKLSAEIILIDDASEEIFRKENEKLQDEIVHFYQLQENIGRCAIRNLFVEKAGGEYLIFLDCDGQVCSTDFLLNYINFIMANPDAEVVYGGRKVSETVPEHNRILRWKFAKERENLSVKKRKENPYRTFQTNNFLVKKEVLEQIKFNPDLKKYGYEDILFAIDLKNRKIKIHHIDNAILNDGLETNEDYLQKVEESATNIAKIAHRKDSRREIKLLKAIHFTKKFGLDKAFLFYFVRKKNYLKKTLLTKPDLRILDLYKLGICLETMKKSK